MALEIIAIPLILGFVEMLKMAFLPSRFAAMTAVGLGIALSFLVGDYGSYGVTIVVGMILGLASSGLYSGSLSTLGKR